MGLRVEGLGFGAKGLGLRVWGEGFGAKGLGLRVWGEGFGAKGLGFRVWVKAVQIKILNSMYLGFGALGGSGQFSPNHHCTSCRFRSQSLNELDYTYTPLQVDRIRGICGSYYNMAKTIFYLLKGKLSVPQAHEELPRL